MPRRCAPQHDKHLVQKKRHGRNRGGNSQELLPYCKLSRFAAAWRSFVTFAACLGVTDVDRLFGSRHHASATGAKASALEFVHLFAYLLLRLASVTAIEGVRAAASATAGGFPAC